eukprot:2179283-Rhodomonas_salina.1
MLALLVPQRERHEAGRSRTEGDSVRGLLRPSLRREEARAVGMLRSATPEETQARGGQERGQR